MPGPVTMDAYLATLTDEQRAGVLAIGEAARRGAPGAAEVISYNMPALRLDGRFLVSWAAFKRHFSLFPASDHVVTTLGAEVEPYVAGKGTLRFPVDRPLPLDLIERIVRLRVEEHGAGGQPAVTTGPNEG